MLKEKMSEFLLRPNAKKLQRGVITMRRTFIISLIMILIFTSCADINGYNSSGNPANQPDEAMVESNGEDTYNPQSDTSVETYWWGTGDSPRSIQTANLNLITTPSGIFCQFSDYDSFDGDFYTFKPSDKSLERHANFYIHQNSSYGSNCFSFTYSASAPIKCTAHYSTESGDIEDYFDLEAGTDVAFTHFIKGAEKGNKLGTYFRIYFTVEETTLFRMPDIFFSYSDTPASSALEQSDTF